MSQLIKIVADDKIPFLQGALDGVAKLSYLPGKQIAREDLLEADGLITRTRTRCDRSLLEGSRVSCIASATIGYDHIDTEYCRSAGIRWSNAPGCNSSSVQQYLVSTLLYLASQRGLDLSKMTLGVVGVGNVGKKVRLAGEALGMKVLLNDPPRERAEGPEIFVSLDKLLEESHVITLHVPLNLEGRDKTQHLVNREFISRCRKGAILINTSRGAVVDEEALKQGIARGSFSEVVLDVFETEPRMDPALHEMLSLATPHIAGYSLDGKANGTSMSVQALSRHFGLGLDNWQVQGLPVPEQPELYGDAAQENREELLWELYRDTYDVSSDDRRLREAPEAFEELRGDYPFRREAPAYSVRLFQGYAELRQVLEKLGFSVLGDYCA